MDCTYVCSSFTPEASTVLHLHTSGGGNSNCWMNLVKSKIHNFIAIQVYWNGTKITGVKTTFNVHIFTYPVKHFSLMDYYKH